MTEPSYTLHLGDCVTVLRDMPAACVQTCITSPPYFGLRDYGNPEQIGLESSVDDYVAKLVAVFAEVRRVLREDGVVFLNLGDSFFSGSQRATSYGTSGKEPEDYPDRDCLCGNLCDVCRVVYQNHKFRNDGLLAAMLTASLSAPNHEHKESGSDHVPTSDLLRQGNRNAHATQDQRRIAYHEDGQLRASLVSMLGESSPQLLDACLQRASHGECLLCARSLTDCAQEYVHRSRRDSEEKVRHTQDNALHDGQQKRHSQCTNKVCGCYSGIESYPDYTTESHATLKPKDLIGIPWRVAFALQADGWYLRSEIIWHKQIPCRKASRTDPPKHMSRYSC